MAAQLLYRILLLLAYTYVYIHIIIIIIIIISTYIVYVIKSFINYFQTSYHIIFTNRPKTKT